nr:hypothetical protein [uncultured Mucilaginibacter sp.]
MKILVLKVILNLFVAICASIPLLQELRKSAEIAKTEAKLLFSVIILIAAVSTLIDIKSYFDDLSKTENQSKEFASLRDQNSKLSAQINESKVATEGSEGLALLRTEVRPSGGVGFYWSNPQHYSLKNFSYYVLKYSDFAKVISQDNAGKKFIRWRLLEYLAVDKIENALLVPGKSGLKYKPTDLREKLLIVIRISGNLYYQELYYTIDGEVFKLYKVKMSTGYANLIDQYGSIDLQEWKKMFPIDLNYLGQDYI